MMDFPPDGDALPAAVRDGVPGVEADERPLVVSISDIHGYLGAARRALGTLTDHDDYDPVVTADDDGRRHWAGGDSYVLVFNGDLVDRGPDNEGVVAMVERLAREAPSGHVRVTLGNHEWGVLFPNMVEWSQWYSGQRTDADREQLCRLAERGHLVAAYDGYQFTYAHAGLSRRYDTGRLNDRFADAAATLREAIGTEGDADTQRELVDQYRRVLRPGRQGGRGFGAGIAWLDFRYLPAEAPPQVVGHTRQDQPVQQGNVVCENVIRANQSDRGGEAVLVESPERLVSLERTVEGDVHAREFDRPDERES